MVLHVDKVYCTGSIHCTTVHWPYSVTRLIMWLLHCLWQLMFKKKVMSNHQQVVSLSLTDEITAREILGPFLPDMARTLPWHISHSKHNKHGKWCLIVDLSSPSGVSNNERPLFTDIYAKVEEVLERLSNWAWHWNGEGRHYTLPMHPLLPMQWQGCVYVDTALLIEVRSAPKLFNALDDAIKWIVKKWLCSSCSITWTISSPTEGNVSSTETYFTMYANCWDSLGRG